MDRNTADPVNTSDLDDIAPVVGYRATRVIATWFAGRHLWVPTDADNGPGLALLIGLPALRALVREFGGKRLRVPTSADDRRLACRRDVAVAFANGVSPARIASDAGLTVRRVEQIRAELVRDGWLTYAQGFAPATNYGRGRRRLSGPEILGTGDESGGPPTPRKRPPAQGSPELARALASLLPA
jgi:hypothetical protein